MFKFIKTILRNLFSPPATRDYPSKKREAFEKARGHIDIDIDDCIFCGICSKQCPVGAIEINKEEKTWEINRYKCVICDYCREKCPKKCITLKNDFNESSLSKQKYKVVKVDKND